MVLQTVWSVFGGVGNIQVCRFYKNGQRSLIYIPFYKSEIFKFAVFTRTVKGHSFLGSKFIARVVAKVKGNLSAALPLI